MIQIRPTFSESWYRVATLKARLRSSAQISRQFYRGERWYVVRDPAGNQFHRLSDAAYRFIGLLDGSRTVEQAWDICGGQLADDAPTQPEIIQILSHLYAANLIEADVTPDATVLLRRHKQLNKRKMQNRLMNVLFPRIPLWDPDAFLVRWMPVVRPMLSMIGSFIWIAVIITGIATISPHWTDLKAAANNAIDPKNWLWLWAVFVLIKLIHELGHAFSCRRFGGECHELGIMFLVFIPTPYVDASSTWAFPSRWHRMFVGAAGMIVELFVAAILAIVWANLGDKTGLPAVLCYNAMLIASVSTLVFNANPLLRYDGYYILSDLLEIPNLRQKSSDYALGLIKRHIFGVKATQPLPPVGQRFWLFTYAISSSVYRMFVGFVIILVVAYKIPILGMLMAIGGVATWAIVPISKLLKYLMLEPELHRKRARASLFCAAVAAIIIIGIGLIPFYVYVDGPGIVAADQHEVVHTKSGGTVTKIYAVDGQMLKPGDKILECEDLKLDADLAQARANAQRLQVELRQANATDQTEKAIVEEAIRANDKKLADALKHKAELTITAPLAGELIAPKLREMMGTFLPRGTEVGTVAALDKLVIRAIVDQNDAQLVEAKASELLDPTNNSPSKDGPIQVLFSGALDPFKDRDPVPATAELFVPEAGDVWHPSLMQPGGGDVAPDPTDPKGQRPQVRQFEIRVKLDNRKEHPFYAGQRAYVRFRVDRQPLIFTWTRRLWQLLQSHENDSKLT
jgi:putative peptide zinc metalloprotease protein